MLKTTTMAIDNPKTSPMIGNPVRREDNKATMSPARIAGSKAAKRAFFTPPAFAPPTNPAIEGPMVGRKMLKWSRARASNQTPSPQSLCAVEACLLLCAPNGELGQALYGSAES
jgi:hypothetical protein